MRRYATALGVLIEHTVRAFERQGTEPEPVQVTGSAFQGKAEFFLAQAQSFAVEGPDPGWSSLLSIPAHLVALSVPAHLVAQTPGSEDERSTNRPGVRSR